MSACLSAEERERYDRQVRIDEIGTVGQEKLKQSRVFVCGAGGLGSPAAIYLAAAGVGAITLVDPDRVALSNLNRQVLHGDDDIGRPKVDSAKATLGHLAPHVAVKTDSVRVTAANVHHLVDGHDVIIDAVDNPETRYRLNRAALDLNIPFIHGAVNGFEGRIMTIVPGKSTCLRCLYRGPVAAAEALPVIGATPGIIGALQATEAIKVITGIGGLLTDRLLIYDGLKLTWREFTVHKNPHCDHCGRPPERIPS
ncbi:HesA/MoeB/ThiF family protein [Desulfosarcina ovata]|uniref:Adenylyltransferase n=2 Tax=Desulfosarcina ovata TaxID=83564 RepID=A0A5K8AMQ7_9BACT|nr:HesA/MoeB/ThiF family protein [Desulfosarcina ovata]BBO85927.1 adenylyltransferase [Desulfosarcina ovata subsp. sediminis]BBO92914.1 adenylyltransferase [Desulfosarcina ovata subsp. ovata]